MDRDTRTLLLWFICLAGAGVLVVLGPYLYAFGPSSWFTLSRYPEDWAKFGEYVGGSLGSFFGLLAFGGVLVTLREQRRLGVLEEFQRQMAVFSMRIDEVLAESPKEADDATLIQIRGLVKPTSIDSLLRTLGNRVMRGPEKDHAIRAKNERAQQLVIPTISRQTNSVQLELQHLIWCLKEHKKLGGTRALSDLYMRRYQPFVCWMEVLKILESEPVREYFRPESFRDAWRAAHLKESKRSASAD